MEPLFNKIIITKAEYHWFAMMQPQDKLLYLFDIFEDTKLQTRAIDLSAFFSEVRDNLERYNESATDVSEMSNNIDSSTNNASDTDFVDVMIDDQNIMIETNSLRALRHVAVKFIESGYMLRRDIATEKMFKKDKTTRYIRVFRIISYNYTNAVCFN